MNDRSITEPLIIEPLRRAIHPNNGRDLPRQIHFVTAAPQEIPSFTLTGRITLTVVAVDKTDFKADSQKGCHGSHPALRPAGLWAFPALKTPSIRPDPAVWETHTRLIAKWARMRQWLLVNSQVHRPRQPRFGSCSPCSRMPAILTFATPRGPMGFTQRQAGGKFTRDEAAAIIAQLLDAESDEGISVAPPAWRQSTREQTMKALSSEQLADELRGRGWTVIEP